MLGLFMLPIKNDLVETSQEVSSSYNQINALMPKKNNQQQDGFILSSLKAVGILPASVKWSDNSEETRVKQQLAYRENAHLIPKGQDGFITTLLKQRGSLDWRGKYEGWGSWSTSEISMFTATKETEDNGRTVTTFLVSDNRNGEMEVRQGLQIIDETTVKESIDSENRVEVLEDQEVGEISALTNR